MSLPPGTWRPAYIGVGSNLGDPAAAVVGAMHALGTLPETRQVLFSSLYRSAPYGGVSQPDFVNAVAAVLTRLGPVDLLRELKSLEVRAGRRGGGERWGPRELDLDLLVYSGVTVGDPDLTVPHPGIAERNFVLLPLTELAPDLVIPGLGRAGSLPVDWHRPPIHRLE